MEHYRISFVGAGNVSGALCRQFFESGHDIRIIVSRTEKTGRALAGSCNAEWSSDPDFGDTSDVIITAVPDDETKGVLHRIKCSEKTIIAHTAGSLGFEVFPENVRHKGIFYPLQTFSENRKTDFRDLPFLLEASDPFTSELLENLTQSTGGNVYFVGTGQRRLIHVAAVFVNNFTNYMLTAGNRIIQKADMPFEVLYPLIEETINKAKEIGPEGSQTGPAARLDIGTFERHIDLLSFSPELQQIYREITDSIIRFYNKSK
ncbi:MAG: F420-dependent NADP oxidoreductase [Bacteroidota bacterium]|nr:F420-dependent NADP oxidoreductase [Bacteroidota bacterium]